MKPKRRGLHFICNITFYWHYKKIKRDTGRMEEIIEQLRRLHLRYRILTLNWLTKGDVFNLGGKMYSTRLCALDLIS